MSLIMVLKYGYWVGTMNKLLVFYGDGVVRDGPCGLDVSQCEHKIVTIEGMMNTPFLDVTKCIKAVFGLEMALKKLIVEAFIVPPVEEGSMHRWGLRQVKGDGDWRSYMKIASKPGAAMYGRPMVYVQFADASEAGCSTVVGEMQLASTGGVARCPIQEDEEGPLLPTPHAGPYRFAVLDRNGHVDGLPDELDSGDEVVESPLDESDEGEGDGPQRAEVPRMVYEAVRGQVATTTTGNGSSTALSLKLLVDSKAQRVLFAEAGKDVVDFLFSLLAVPVGTAVKLIGKEAMVGCVGNLYGSAEKLNGTYVQPGAAKDALLRLCPAMLSPAASSLLGLPAVSSSALADKVMYTVTDDLKVTAMSAISSITLLGSFGIRDLSTLQEKTVQIGYKEGLAILKASLQSRTVLTDVFLGGKKLPGA